MARGTTSYAADTAPILPGALYTLSAFTRAAGVAKTRQREAALSGLPLPKLYVGKRAYVRGADGIAWIEKLAAATADPPTN